MSKKQPKTPDPYAVSDAQTKSNKETAAYNASLNRIDQSSPFGSITYQTNGTDPTTGAPLYSQNTQLSPELQGLLNSQIGAQQGISSAITGNLGNLPTGPFDPSGIDTTDIYNKSLESQLASLNPQFEKGWTNLETTMSDRGLPIGSEIWNNQLGEYNRAKDTSLLAASRQAQQDAQNEAQRQFGNAQTQYMLPYQTLSSLMGNSQSVQNPSFNSFATSAAPATDVAGNVWKSYSADQQAAQQGNSNLFSGLLGAAKLGLGAYTGGLFG